MKVGEPSADGKASLGYAAWLQHSARPGLDIPDQIVVIGKDPLLQTAGSELQLGLSQVIGRAFSLGSSLDEPSVILGTIKDLHRVPINLSQEDGLFGDGYLLQRRGTHLVVSGLSPKAVLYGAFGLLRRMSSKTESEFLEILDNPAVPIRYLNHWDNLDGSIERGYAGRSIFYRDGGQNELFITEDLDRVADYARLIASVGINGCSLNNVNADDRIYEAQNLPQIALLAEQFRTYGVRSILSVDLASPIRLGGLSTFDPLNSEVQDWWKDKVEEILETIPDMVGLVVKADSEGRRGPSTYGRTHADAANMLARLISPIGAHLFYRGFVYDHKLDWRDRSLDRARAAYENFKPLDGQFEPNVVIQLKGGPIDFQVREPASPTFAALEHTQTAVELMITQEYLGQQHHTVFEVPWWKDVLDFDFGLPDVPSRVKDIAMGKTFAVPATGFIAVSGVGRDSNWFGNHLAQANLYGFGRLAWAPELSSAAIADEWIRQTFSDDQRVRSNIGHILNRSWNTYENYTGNLGIGGLTDIIHIHYGPAPESSEQNGWGQWHRSDHLGTGMDRTVDTGTGFTRQYPPKSAELFESLKSCPEELLLFFHHVPYGHRLKSGKSVIQHVYDAHYDGAAEVEDFIRRWKSLKGIFDELRFEEVLAQLEYQAGHAIVWRDAICWWFGRLSGIEDESGRVFHEPNRFGSDALSLDGYEWTPVQPWEAAEGGQAAVLKPGVEQGQVSLTFSGSSAIYDLGTWFYDVRSGNAQYSVSIDDIEVDSWLTTDRFPSSRIDAHTKVRHFTRRISLKQGSRIDITGKGEGANRAAIDFLEILQSD